MRIGTEHVVFETMRSGGPGGQNADKRSTAVRVRAYIEDLPLSDEERQYLVDYLPPKNRTKDGELLVQTGEYRSQQENRRRALELANEEIENAIEKGRREVEKQRRKRRINRGSGGGGGGGEEDIQETLKKRRRSETTDDLLEQAYREDPGTMKRFLDDEEDEPPE